jgi:hypothetical protein
MLHFQAWLPLSLPLALLGSATQLVALSFPTSQREPCCSEMLALRCCITERSQAMHVYLLLMQ